MPCSICGHDGHNAATCVSRREEITNYYAEQLATYNQHSSPKVGNLHPNNTGVNQSEREYFIELLRQNNDAKHCWGQPNEKEMSQHFFK